MLRAPLLEEMGVAHAFGTRGDAEPPGLLRPRQVHGSVVVEANACRVQPVPEADAVVSSEAGVPIGVVTADCLPILLASERVGAVAAVHAGWRGLAAGVVEAGVRALRAHAAGEAVTAVVGPHVGPCCYEVDAPVLDALATRHDALLEACLSRTRPQHARLDLGALALAVLACTGVERCAAVPAACTSCDSRRFHSYRRDGARAGRLLHRIAAGPFPPGQPSA